jgi:acetyl esterase
MTLSDAGESEFADSGIARYLIEINAGPDEGESTVEELRRGGAARARFLPPGPELHELRDLEIEGLHARLYRPSPDPVPLILYLHGGGWTFGSVATHDRLTRLLAHLSGAAVLSLDYRLAPEHPWPAAVDDAITALDWIAGKPAVLGEVDYGSVAIAGDSAGGTLATLACLRLRDTHPDALPALQLLIYPNTDLAGDHPSMREKGSGYGLSEDAVRFFIRQWVPDQSQRSDPRVSPLHADNLGGLPAAVIVTAEHDPLRDEGELYAERLRDAGVGVVLRREPGLIHNFMRLDHISPASARAIERVAQDLSGRLRS